MTDYSGKSGEWSASLHPTQVLRAVPAAVLVVRRDELRVIDLTSEAAEALGYARPALVSRRLEEILVLPPRAVLVDAVHKTVDGGTVRLDAVCRRGDGSPMAVPVSISALPEDRGEPLVLVSVPTEAWQRMDEALKSTTRALHEANQFLDTIVENIPDMVFVKDAQTLLFERFNRAGESLLGWSREELIGKTDHDFYPKEQADFFHRKDRETLRAGVLVDIPEEPIDTRHGRRWLHTKKVPILDEKGRARFLLGISEDITERKAAEERAHALEREITSIVQHAREAIVSWTLDGTIASWNRAAETLYGVDAARAVGAQLDAIFADAANTLREAQARLLAGETLPLAHETRLRAGVEIEIEESLFLLRDGRDEPVRVASVARDVSEVALLRRTNELLAPRRRTSGNEQRSEAMRETLAAAELVAQDSFATVLLTGETGVGKSWVAHRIHAQSPRAERAFFEVNCASLGAQLAESELFGHERGAFTGATTQKRGLVEVANGGTLFLDEIGELPSGAQAQLLTFLDAKRFRRVGGTHQLTADVRILAATNANLEADVERGAFRKDLYYRLSVVPIRIPPLRERQSEIAALAAGVVAELAARTGSEPPPITADVLRALESYAWPGNVRELRNALERAMILGRAAAIRLEHLPYELRARRAPVTDRLESRERDHILKTLEACGGNRTQAAERLGISRSTLKRKLAQLRREPE